MISKVPNGVLASLHNGRLLKSVNYTHIALIPKIKSPKSMHLCIVLYKIILKVLANRIKKVLSQVISDTQSAFVPGRLITDNLLVAFESLNYMKIKRQGRTTHMVVKLDMSKAYNKVEWDFLRVMMEKMGFDDRWIHLIM